MPEANKNENVKPGKGVVGEVPWADYNKDLADGRLSEIAKTVGHNRCVRNPNYGKVKEAVQASVMILKNFELKWDTNPHWELDGMTLSKRADAEGKEQWYRWHGTISQVQSNMKDVSEILQVMEEQCYEGTHEETQHTVIGRLLLENEDLKAEVGRLGKIVDAHTDAIGDDKVAEAMDKPEEGASTKEDKK